MSKAKKTNPHCPVAGCKIAAPHLSEPTEKELHDIFAKPTTTAEWVKHCIAEIIDSAVDDLKKQPNPRFLAFVLRWRQAHEMYIRALYVLFLAAKDEIPHVVSGEVPNSFAVMYREVNRKVLDDTGTLEDKQIGLRGEEFTMMELLNQAAHGSFMSIGMTLGLLRDPNRFATADKLLSVWNQFANHLDFAQNKFREGKTKDEVLAEFKKTYVKAKKTATPPTTTP
jgi:hypothetical protein